MSKNLIECAFWESLKRGLSVHFPGIHLVRIENSVGGGIPDFSMAHRGHERWIELKIKRGRTIEFKGSQHAWIAQAIAAGRKVAVMVREGDAVRLYKIKSPSTTLMLQDHSHTVNADWTGSMPLLRWDDLMDSLVNF